MLTGTSLHLAILQISFFNFKTYRWRPLSAKTEGYLTMSYSFSPKPIELEWTDNNSGTVCKTVTTGIVCQNKKSSSEIVQRNFGACEKHSKSHRKCPLDCPNRTEKAEAKRATPGVQVLPYNFVNLTPSMLVEEKNKPTKRWFDDYKKDSKEAPAKEAKLTLKTDGRKRSRCELHRRRHRKCPPDCPYRAEEARKKELDKQLEQQQLEVSRQLEQLHFSFPAGITLPPPHQLSNFPPPASISHVTTALSNNPIIPATPPPTPVAQTPAMAHSDRILPSIHEIAAAATPASPLAPTPMDISSDSELDRPVLPPIRLPNEQQSPKGKAKKPNKVLEAFSSLFHPHHNPFKRSENNDPPKS